MVVLRRVEKQNINEAKQVGTLYHVCTLDALVQYIIPNNELRASGKYWNELLKTNQQVCFTRDPLFVVPTDTVSYGNNILFQFVVDGDKLSERYKVTPFNYTGSADNQRYREKEEDVIGPIKNFKSYVKEVRFDIKNLNVEKDDIQDIVNKLEDVKKYLGSIKCRRSELPFLTKHWSVKFGKVKNPNYKINTLDEFIELLKEFVNIDEDNYQLVDKSKIDTIDLFIEHIGSLSFKEIKDILEEHPTWIKHIDITKIHLKNTEDKLDLIKYFVEKGVIFKKDILCDYCTSDTYLEIVKLLVEHGADVNAKNEYGSTPLLKAIGKDSIKVFKYLLENGADVNVKNNDGDSPIVYACDLGDLEDVKLLVEYGADVNSVGRTNKSILLHILERERSDIAEVLIKNGAYINVKDDKGRTPLLLVCEYSTKLAKLLIEKGADVNVKDNYGNTPLSRAFRSNKLDLVKLLIVNGANIDIVPREDFLTNKDLLKVLIDSGYDINSRNTDNENLLNIAFRRYFYDNSIVTFLVENGIDVNNKSITGETPLLQVIKGLPRYKNDLLPIIKLLIEHGADVNVKDKNEKSPLYYALMFEDLSLIKLLVENGADVNEEGSSELPILLNACLTNRLDIVKYLVENGADVNKIEDYELEDIHDDNIVNYIKKKMK